MTQLTIHADAIRLLLPYIGPSERTMHGVRLERHPRRGALAVATDGHKMGVAYDKHATLEEGFEGATVDVSGIAHALTPDYQKERLEMRSVRFDGDALWVMTEPGVMCAACARCAIRGDFPNWRNALPKPDGAPCFATFNAGHVEHIARGFAEVAGPGAHRATIVSRHPTKATLIRFDDRHLAVRFFAVLMPMRGDAALEVMPDWALALAGQGDD